MVAKKSKSKSKKKVRKKSKPKKAKSRKSKVSRKTSKKTKSRSVSRSKSTPTKTSSKPEKGGPKGFATLSYLVQIFNIIPSVTGVGAVLSLIVFLIAQKRYTKYHALQSTFVGILVSLLTFALANGMQNGNPIIPMDLPFFYALYAVVVVVLLLMVSMKANKGEWLELPLFSKLTHHFV